MPQKYKRKPESDFNQAVNHELHKQRLFKEAAGHRIVPLSVMKEHAKKIERCNRLLALIRKMKMCLSPECCRVLDYGLLTSWFPTLASQIAFDLNSLGVPLAYPLSFGRLIPFEKQIGARKGAYRKKDSYYRTISKDYSRWIAKRDPFGGRL